MHELSPKRRGGGHCANYLEILQNSLKYAAI